MAWNGGSVRLGDVNSIAGQVLGFDAVRWSRTQAAADVASTGPVPREFALLQNFPNPFNPATELSFQLSSASRITLSVFDVLGRQVATLANDVRTAGSYVARWDASNLPSGVYYCRLVANPVNTHAGGYVWTIKMVLMK
jgi:hypothetical protein